VLPRPKGTKAWVVRWEWAGEHAKVAQPVAALLRPQTGTEHVKRIVKALHDAQAYAPLDMLAAIERNGHDPYPAYLGTVSLQQRDGRRGNVPFGGEIICGHNPFLVARKGRVWRADAGSGRIEWEDDPRPYG
jgi:hypothetical protein